MEGQAFERRAGFAERLDGLAIAGGQARLGDGAPGHGLLGKAKPRVQAAQGRQGHDVAGRRRAGLGDQHLQRTPAGYGQGGGGHPGVDPSANDQDPLHATLLASANWRRKSSCAGIEATVRSTAAFRSASTLADWAGSTASTSGS